MPVTPWGSAIRTLNKELKQSGYTLNDQPVRMKVRSRVSDDGSQMVDALGFWDSTSTKPQVRSTGIGITAGSYEKQLPLALAKTKELIETCREGYDTKQTRKAPEPRITTKTGSRLSAQMEKARAFLNHRHTKRGTTVATLDRHLMALDRVESYINRTGKDLRLETAARAVLEHRGSITKKNYGDDIDILRAVCSHLEVSVALPLELDPTYKYEPGQRTYPSDETIAQRLMAIKDPYTKQLIYSVIGFGRRISEIWGMDWDGLMADGQITVEASKNRMVGGSWLVPFGDEQISLKGFKPPHWEELNYLGQGKPSKDQQEPIKREANRISQLVSRHLGCTATDMRHRWPVAVLTNPEYSADPYSIAKAMCTSMQQLEKTYSRELVAYRRRTGWSPFA